MSTGKQGGLASEETGPAGRLGQAGERERLLMTASGKPTNASAWLMIASAMLTSARTAPTGAKGS